MRAALGRLLSDGGFRFNVARIVVARTAAAADDGIGGGETFVYDFRLPSAINGLAAHCMELPFVWDCLDAPRVVERNTGANPPQPIADLAHGAWVGFIGSGDPGWPGYHQDTRQGMIFDREPRTAPVFIRESALAPPGDQHR